MEPSASYLVELVGEVVSMLPRPLGLMPDSRWLAMLVDGITSWTTVVPDEPPNSPVRYAVYSLCSCFLSVAPLST